MAEKSPVGLVSKSMNDGFLDFSSYSRCRSNRDAFANICPQNLGLFSNIRGAFDVTVSKNDSFLIDINGAFGTI